LLSDFVLAKLDAATAENFMLINRGVDVVSFDRMVSSLCAFRKRFKGRLALQIMFIEDNRHQAKNIAEIAKKIGPDEVQINTPLRPCATKPLTEKQISAIKKEFIDLDVVAVYDALTKPFSPFDEARTKARHGNYRS